MQKCSRLLATTFISFFLIFSVFNTVQAAPQCNNLISLLLSAVQQSKPLKYGEIKPDFKHSPLYSKQVPFLGKIKDQCSLGTCHLHAWSSYLEANYRKNNSGRSIEISTEYLSLAHWVFESLSLLHSKNQDLSDIKLGASSFASRSAILKFGIMPRSAWTLGSDFQSARTSQVMMEYIRNIIAGVKQKNAAIGDPQVKKKNLLEAQQLILEVFEESIGMPDRKFEFEGQIYTPVEFQKKFFKEIGDPLVMILLADDTNHVYRLRRNQNDIFQMRYKLIESTIKQLIDAGKPVFLGYEHNGAYVDRKTGIMSIEAFHMPPGAAPLAKDMRQHFSIQDGQHAVQIVAYDADPITQNVIKFKIQNSWGKDAGDSGFYHMYVDYFRAFASQIVFTKDPNLKLPEPSIIVPVQGDLF